QDVLSRLTGHSFMQVVCLAYRRIQLANATSSNTRRTRSHRAGAACSRRRTRYEPCCLPARGANPALSQANQCGDHRADGTARAPRWCGRRRYGRRDPPDTPSVVIIIESSAMVDALVGNPANPHLLAAIADEDLHAPALLDFEVASALRGHLLAGKLNKERC